MKKFLSVSSRSHYGLRIMTQLALTNRHLLSLKTIAERERLSLGYLEELARALRKNNLIASVRGAHGGYKLAKPASEISVADVLISIEGPVRTMICLGDRDTRFRCPVESRCPSRLVWQKVDEQIKKTLTSITLADLCSRHTAVAGAKLI